MKRQIFDNMQAFCILTKDEDCKNSGFVLVRLAGVEPFQQGI